MHTDTDTAHLHAHRAGDAKHKHYTGDRSLKVLGWAVALTLGFAGVEAVSGFLANSLALISDCLLYTSPSPRDRQKSRMPSSA